MTTKKEYEEWIIDYLLEEYGGRYNDPDHDWDYIMSEIYEYDREHAQVDYLMYAFGMSRKRAERFLSCK